jgi:hypothetical protein
LVSPIYPEDIDNLEEVIDLDRDMERYVKEIKTTTGISNGHI